MRQLLSSTLACLALLAAAPASIAQAPATEAPATVMVIFDGSGSMWGRIAGAQTPKFAVAREALKPALSKLRAGTLVGLSSFGHRRQADCSDTEVLHAPDQPDAGRLFASLEKLNPRGKGPMTKALREAAVALKQAPGARHVLLIHDDADNCAQDPCQAAAEIKAADPSIRLHVVSLAMDAENSSRPVCLAATTGGIALPAETATDATTAIATILETIARQPPPRALPVAAIVPPASDPVAAKVTAREPSTTGPPRLRLSLRPRSAPAAVDAAIRWRVSPVGGSATAVAELVQAAPELPLPAGRYRFEMFAGLVTANGEVEVKPEGATEHVVEVDAATLTIAATMKRGGVGSPTARIAIGRPGAPEPMWIGQSGVDRLVLPPGPVQIKVREGEVAAEQTVTLAPGQAGRVDVALETGRLRLAALAREGGAPLADVVFRILEDDPEAPSGQREVARSSAPAPDFLLPAGAYVVVARTARGEARERLLITPGEEVSKVLTLDVGTLRLAATAAAATAGDAEFMVEVVPEAGGTTSRVLTSDGRAELELPQGRYRLVVRVGNQNAVAERQVEVRSGQATEAQVEIPAGRVDLRIASSAATVLGLDALWEISDQAGRPVWRTLRPTPRAWLAPGRYTVVVNGRSATAQHAFEVRPGNAHVVEITSE